MHTDLGFVNELPLAIPMSTFSIDISCPIVDFLRVSNIPKSYGRRGKRIDEVTAIQDQVGSSSRPDILDDVADHRRATAIHLSGCSTKAPSNINP